MLVNHIEAVLISISCVTNVQKQHLSFNAFVFETSFFPLRTLQRNFYSMCICCQSMSVSTTEMYSYKVSGSVLMSKHEWDIHLGMLMLTCDIGMLASDNMKTF